MHARLAERAILHLDMDAFYPAVEALDDPSLAGKPVVVGGAHPRGVVSSASYEAREFGVHSAQPMVTAIRLCPYGVFRPVRMWRYREVSRQVFEIFHRFTPLVEAISIDEAFLDVTASRRLFGPAEAIAGRIKKAVREEIGITLSAGIAPSKFVAKIASDLDKPDGLIAVPDTGVLAFLDPLPIARLWGVGNATRELLSGLGVRTIGELRRVPEAVLVRDLGKHGAHLHRLSRGIDEREVVPEHVLKSVGHEQTFPEDLTEREAMRRELLALSTRVSRRMRVEGVEGGTVTLKVTYAGFVQVTRSRTLAQPTDDGAEIFRVACRLLGKTEAGTRPVRLLGVTLSGLLAHGTVRQPSLFASQASRPGKRELNRALDRIAERFGEGAVVPAPLLKKR